MVVVLVPQLIFVKKVKKVKKKDLNFVLAVVEPHLELQLIVVMHLNLNFVVVLVVVPMNLVVLVLLVLLKPHLIFVKKVK